MIKKIIVMLMVSFCSIKAVQDNDEICITSKIKITKSNLCSNNEINTVVTNNNQPKSIYAWCSSPDNFAVLKIKKNIVMGELLPYVQEIANRMGLCMNGMHSMNNYEIFISEVNTKVQSFVDQYLGNNTDYCGLEIGILLVQPNVKKTIIYSSETSFDINNNTFVQKVKKSICNGEENGTLIFNVQCYDQNKWFVPQINSLNIQ